MRRAWPLAARLAAIALLAVLVRAAVFGQLLGGPCLHLHHWPQSDMAFFHQWASLIAAGDWLTDRPLHPVHDWHVALAQAYLAEHPQAVPPADEVERAEALWNQWYGGKRFHQEPLYPYLLAVLYSLSGHDALHAIVMQLSLGVVNILLLYLVTRRHFGEAAGWVAAMLAIFCGPLIFHEMQLLRTTLITTGGLAAAWVTGWAMLGPQRQRRWLAVGFTCGLAYLTQITAGLLWPAAMLATGWAQRRQPRQAAMSLAIISLGFALALLPLVGRNLAVGVSPLALSSTGAVTFIGSNSPHPPPDLAMQIGPAILDVLPRVAAGETSALRGTLALHDGAGSYLRLLGRKLANAWSRVEQPNNASFYYFRRHAWTLYLLPVSFALIAPLAMIGGVLALRRLRREPAFFMLYALAAQGMITLLLTTPYSRHRASLTAWLIPLAAMAVVTLARWLVQRRWEWSLVALAGVLVFWCLTQRDPAGVERIRSADYLAPFVAYYLPKADAAAQRGDWLKEEAILSRSLSVLPPEVATPAPENDAPARSDLLSFYAGVYARYGQALRQVQRVQDALVAERKAMELAAAAQRHE